MSVTATARRLLGSLALVAGLAIGLATTAGAQPSREDDFLECVADHQDTDGIAVCCVFYGGELEADDQECYIDFAPDARPGPVTTRPQTAPRLPVVTLG